MSNPIKILSLGISQSNFLSQLYGDLKKKFPEYTVSVNQFFDLSNGQINNKSIFDQHYDFDRVRISQIESYRSFLQLAFTNIFWEILFFELSQNKSLKKAYYFLRSFAYNKIVAEKYIIPLKYDVFHFHFCNPLYLKYLHFFPKDKKIVCSFWGSDLMRETGITNVFYVKKALEKADVITIQNQELAEMLYCKYGREFQNKTKVIQFTLHEEIYEMIDTLRDDKKKIIEFKLKYNIPTGKTVIAVSHNEFRANNHLLILSQIEKLEENLKNRIVILLHLGYGREEEYLQEIDFFCKSTKLDIVLIDSFFDARDTALLRLSIDLMIQMPISDALSGAMTEILYAGNQVYAGAWLPYGILRRNGIHFDEVQEYHELPIKIQDYFNNKDVIKSLNKNNAFQIRNFLFPDKTTSDWNLLFKDLTTN